ncbi:calcium homeostasis endoplasmic reticulum protein-like [Palaemon carinicauda]|uniref:calcium homeostasis endoplasmic reticulum protein-like n=1 Tax=Palaemon carinicauda TaxID=392227 RepID=UPI0035B6A465
MVLSKFAKGEWERFARRRKKKAKRDRSPSESSRGRENPRSSSPAAHSSSEAPARARPANGSVDRNIDIDIDRSRATTLDLSGNRSRSPLEDGRPSGQGSPQPSTSKAADALYAPPEPAIAQSPGPLGSQGLERKTAPLFSKRKALPAPVAAVPVVADKAPRRSPVGVRAADPVTR